MLYVAEVAGAIERMKARVGEVGRVADVVKPRGGFDQVGVLAKDGSEGAGLCGDTFDVGPEIGRASCRERV